MRSCEPKSEHTHVTKEKTNFAMSKKELQRPEVDHSMSLKPIVLATHTGPCQMSHTRWRICPWHQTRISHTSAFGKALHNKSLQICFVHCISHLGCFLPPPLKFGLRSLTFFLQLSVPELLALLCFRRDIKKTKLTCYGLRERAWRRRLRRRRERPPEKLVFAFVTCVCLDFCSHDLFHSGCAPAQFFCDV